MTERPPTPMEAFTRVVIEAQISYAVKNERKRLIEKLESYLEITVFTENVEGAEPNPEWTKGFQAALSLIKNEVTGEE